MRSACDLTDAKMKGYLQQRTNKSVTASYTSCPNLMTINNFSTISVQLFQQTWKKLWFVLDSRSLTVYPDEEQEDDIDSVLADYDVDQVDCKQSNTN